MCVLVGKASSHHITIIIYRTLIRRNCYNNYYKIFPLGNNLTKHGIPHQQKTLHLTSVSGEDFYALFPHLPELSVIHPGEGYLGERKRKAIELMPAKLIPCYQKVLGQQRQLIVSNAVGMVGIQQAHSYRLHSSVS